MRGRLAICAAALALPMLATSPPASARGGGFHGAGLYAVGLHGAHVHGLFRGGLHRGHRNFHRRARYPYGYLVVPSGYEDVGVPLYVGPHCVKTEETVVVPGEHGGERTIRITRC